MYRLVVTVLLDFETTPVVVFNSLSRSTELKVLRSIVSPHNLNSKTFTPNHSSLRPVANEKLYLLAYFENLTPDDIEKAKNAALLYFRYKMPRNSASCLVDRFDKWPLNPDN